MTRLLVTGANGFIGRHCLAALRSNDMEVHATTTQSHVRRSSFEHWHTCDLLDHEAASRLVNAVRPTHLLHLAWIATPGVYWTSPLNEAWRAASRHLAECFAACGGERLIVTGTCAEYDWGKRVCAENDHHPNPTTPYAQAKLALFHELTEMADSRGVRFAWARLFWMYGPFEPPSRLVPSIILSLLRNKPALCTDGTHRRDYLHVSDVASALARLVGSSAAGPINVASGMARPIASIATTIADAMSKRHLLQLGAIKSPSAEAPLVVAEIGRLRNEIDFQPQYSLEAGLCDTIRWWAEQVREEQEHSPANAGPRRAEGAYIA